MERIFNEKSDQGNKYFKRAVGAGWGLKPAVVEWLYSATVTGLFISATEKD